MDAKNRAKSKHLTPSNVHIQLLQKSGGEKLAKYILAGENL
jgi:hypothetical protein